ncbi:dienelactone hydrolase family protein [Planctomyces sp. SH-PL14]|uniref:dienelactone hydrolase family protein n=1 Tax=Planctomyces sp. SH-PL14 TaxID=1632864 RepID=UPI00078D5AC8|nr:alpha/beta hydrolase family protein [Planctomyces sp. SH-PL14]AMV19413.1 esterase [Planctomyces sp. SH-PL14]
MPESNRRDFLRTATMTVTGSLAAASASAAETKDGSATPEPTFRDHLLRCLGGPWPEPGPLEARVLKTEQKDGYRLEWVNYLAEPEDRIPAILLVPDGVSDKSPAPGICLWHEHAGRWNVGKIEPAGLGGDPMHYTGVALAKLGYVVLCPDALAFGERRDATGKLDGPAFERFEFLRYVVAGKCMAWKNILDMRRAVDYIVSRPEVVGEKLGCYGHSMGSTHTWLVGPWEPRLKCLVGNCCLPTYKAIHRTHLLHCFPNFIPGIYQYGDTPDIAGLIAPRPLHLNIGETDGGSPIEEVREGIETIAKAYAKQNASDRFTAFIEPDTGHVLSPAMWDLTKAFFAKHLA